MRDYASTTLMLSIYGSGYLKSSRTCTLLMQRLAAQRTCIAQRVRFASSHILCRDLRLMLALQLERQAEHCHHCVEPCI